MLVVMPTWYIQGTTRLRLAITYHWQTLHGLYASNSFTLQWICIVTDLFTYNCRIHFTELASKKFGRQVSFSSAPRNGAQLLGFELLEFIGLAARKNGLWHFQPSSSQQSRGVRISVLKVYTASNLTLLRVLILLGFWPLKYGLDRWWFGESRKRAVHHSEAS